METKNIGFLLKKEEIFTKTDKNGGIWRPKISVFEYISLDTEDRH